MADEALRSRIVGMAQGAMALDLAFVGISGGLLPALEAPIAPPALARRTGTDEGYVRRWCEAAFAFELLDRQGGDYVLTELGRAFLPEVPGTLMPLAINVVLAAHMADHAVTGLYTGVRPGEVVLGERENVGRWFGPMLEATFGPLFDAHVLPAISAFGLLDRPGARACDLACGNGWYLRRLAGRFSELRGVGIDGYAPNIEDAVRRAGAEGLTDRLTFEVSDVLHHRASEPYHLVAMNRALHHVWSVQADVFSRIAADLVPGGAVVIWEPRWPDDISELRHGALRPMAFQNLTEHVQGNHFLRPDEVAEAMAAAGLRPEVHLLLEGREMVIVGHKPG